jgi:hypothetical protein
VKAQTVMMAASAMLKALRMMSPEEF